ncbi:MAG: hypothetical protein BRD57_06420, partial [Proteobacteria bacterium SW_6_67_9]
MLAVTAACSVAPTQPIDGSADTTGACRALFERVDTAVAAANVRDAGAARIDGFPWLRVTRPLASWRDETATPRRFRAWVDRLAAADRRARRHELANLGAPERTRLRAQWAPAAQRHDWPHRLAPALATCREHLRAQILDGDDARQRLRERAVAPDAYSTWQRALGLYPIAWRIARPRIQALQAERDAAFVRSVGNVLGSAIENRRTRNELEGTYGRISDAFFALDEGLVAALALLDLPPLFLSLRDAAVGD